jgi:hypothetical protein
VAENSCRPSRVCATRRPCPTHPDGTASNRLSPPLVTLRRNKLAKHCSVSIKVSGYLFCCPLYDVFLLVERDGGACRSFNRQADGEIKRADAAVYHFCGFVLGSLQSACDCFVADASQLRARWRAGCARCAFYDDLERIGRGALSEGECACALLGGSEFYGRRDVSSEHGSGASLRQPWAYWFCAQCAGEEKHER